jgi:hypothetical protein
MKRFIPIIIIIVLLLAAVLVFVHCMRSEQPPAASEPQSLVDPDVLQDDMGNDTAEPGRLDEQPPGGIAVDSASGGNAVDSASGGSQDGSTPGGDPDSLITNVDPVEINVMLGTWHVEAVSTIGEVSLHDTTMTFNEANRWTIDGTVTLTVPGISPISTGLHGGGTYTYDPAESMLVVNNETYDSKEICRVEVIDENTLLITILEYIGEGELLYDVYTLTRA